MKNKSESSLKNPYFDSASSQTPAQNLKWAMESRRRWMAATERLETKLDLATKALDEIASMKASKHRYDGLKGAADMQEIAATAIVRMEKI